MKDIAKNIDIIIKKYIYDILTEDKEINLQNDLIYTDSIGEVIEKLCILNCRMWYLEDAISNSNSDNEIADLKRKIDICFKQKRPKYIEAINRMLDEAILNGKKLSEDSVKLYK
jgi:hypothetical protein